jgi:hypothetical protein
MPWSRGAESRTPDDRCLCRHRSSDGEGRTLGQRLAQRPSAAGVAGVAGEPRKLGGEPELGFSTNCHQQRTDGRSDPPTLTDGPKPPAARRACELSGHGTQLSASDPEVERSRQQQHNKRHDKNNRHGCWPRARRGQPGSPHATDLRDALRPWASYWDPSMAGSSRPASACSRSPLRSSADHPGLSTV